MAQSLDFADKYILVSTDDKAIINHLKKSLLFNKQKIWIEKESRLFDVTVGKYDGAEVCELVGVFILYQLSRKYNKSNIGLYKDHGVAVFKNITGHKQKKLGKNIRTYSVKII